MQFFSDLWFNVPLRCSAISWAVAQGLKVLITLWLDKRLDWRRCFGMGGMPSSHSAFVFSLMLAIGISHGVSTPEFALAFGLAAVVIYDAMGVRRETGKQGAVLNQILSEVLVEGKPITEQQLKELVGHTPLEVAAGVILGLLITLIFA